MNGRERKPNIFLPLMAVASIGVAGCEPTRAESEFKQFERDVALSANNVKSEGNGVFVVSCGEDVAVCDMASAQFLNKNPQLVVMERSSLSDRTTEPWTTTITLETEKQ